MNKFKQIILTLLLCTTGMNAWAYYFEKDGIYYNIKSNSDPYTVEVTNSGQLNSYSGDVVIPESVTNEGIGYSVTMIGTDAFNGSTGLTSITIGNSVTTIGGRAFEDCIGLTSVTIPNSVTYIGNDAFRECTGLTSVTIGNSVNTIEQYAFSSCTGLTSVNFNATNCIRMGQGGCPVFWGCLALTTLNIGNQVQTIPAYAFFGCTGLTSVTIGNSVNTIETLAFSGCTGLTSIIIPNSVTTIGGWAFSNTGWYNNQPDGILYLDGWCLGYKGEEPVGILSIEEGTINIAIQAFFNCTDITSVTIPNSVTTIGAGAFYGCTGLISVAIGNSISTIRQDAFKDCSSLDTIIALGTTPPTLGTDAFSGISSETVLVVPCGTTTSYSQQFNMFNMFDPNNIYEECNSYPVTVNPTGSTGGEISVSANSAQLGEDVEVYVTLEDGYVVESIVAYNANNPSQIVPISLAGAKDVLTYSFVMMPFPVKIEATFRSSAQDFHYDFEQCNVGDKVAATLGEPWTTWSQNPGSTEDAIISDEQSVGTRSLKIDTGNDVVLKLGDQTAGSYRISFDMFVPEGKEGYFNILHDFADQNSTWAFEVFINHESYGTGVAEIIDNIRHQLHPFYFSLNEWNNFVIEYSVDDAMVCIKINGVNIVGVIFSNANHNLSAIDFLATSSDGSRNGFYVDNITFEALEGPFTHNITTSPDEINVTMEKDTTCLYLCELTNEGNAIMHTVSWIDYGVGEDGGEPVSLHHDSDPHYTYGNYNNNPYIELGVSFTYETLSDNTMIGRKITGMQYYVPYSFQTGGAGPITFRIYKRFGLRAEMDKLIAEKVVEDFPDSEWLTVEFDEPIPLCGFGVFATVGFQQVNNGYPISLDAGPVNYDGDMVRLDGGSWFNLNYAQEYGNHNIRLICEGQPVTANWATIPYYASFLIEEDDYFIFENDYFICGGDVEYVPIAFNTNGLDYGEYEAILRVETNDEDIEIAIPIHLNVTSDGIGEQLESWNSVYPNPASDVIHIEGANDCLAAIYDATGKMVSLKKIAGNSISVSNLDNGVYFLCIVNNKGEKTTQKIIVSK